MATKKYTIAQKCKDVPRRFLLDGKWIGIGGKIEIAAQPPKAAQTIKEATDAQYLKVADRCPDLVQKIKQ